MTQAPIGPPDSRDQDDVAHVRKLLDNLSARAKLLSELDQLTEEEKRLISAISGTETPTLDPLLRAKTDADLANARRKSLYQRAFLTPIGIGMLTISMASLAQFADKTISDTRLHVLEVVLALGTTILTAFIGLHEFWDTRKSANRADQG